MACHANLPRRHARLRTLKGSSTGSGTGAPSTTSTTSGARTGAKGSPPEGPPYRYLLLPGNEAVLMREALERRPWWQAAGGPDDTNWNMWCGLNGQRFTSYDLLAAAARRGGARLVNRLEEHKVVCTKSGLANVLAAVVQTRGSQPWIPETYVLPGGPKAAEAGGSALSRFRAAYAKHAERGRKVWIAKPTSLNRGNGIEVFDGLDQLLAHLRTRKDGTNMIVQKYIEAPLLLGGRKFDIRAYVLVAPDGAVYFHREAYVRTSSTPYDAGDLANRSAHLTNDAVQKHLDTYHTFEDHCKLSFEELGPSLARATGNTPAGCAAPPPPPQLDTRPGSESGVWGAMRHCVAQLFAAAGPQLNPRRLQHCWELLGLDFMLDDQGGLYLIEVNTSPALFRAGAYLADLLPRVVEEVVQRVVDPLFPAPGGAGQQAAGQRAAGQQAAGSGDGQGEGQGAGLGGGGGDRGAAGAALDGFVLVLPGGRAGGGAGGAAGSKAGASKPPAAGSKTGAAARRPVG